MSMIKDVLYDVVKRGKALFEQVLFFFSFTALREVRQRRLYFISAKLNGVRNA